MSNFEYDTDTVDIGNEKTGKREYLEVKAGDKYRIAPIWHNAIYDAEIKKYVENTRRSKKQPDQKEVDNIIAKALKAKAEELGKSVSDLTDIDKLDQSSLKIVKREYVYIKGVGPVLNRMGKDGPSADVFWQEQEEPRVAYHTYVLVYPTDKKMVPSLESMRNDDWRIVELRMSKQTFGNFQTFCDSLKLENVALTSKDIITQPDGDPRYKKMTFASGGACVFRADENIRNRVLQAAVDEFYSRPLDYKDWTTSKIIEKLKSRSQNSGGNQGGPSQGGPSQGGNFASYKTSIEGIL